MGNVSEKAEYRRLMIFNPTWVDYSGPPFKTALSLRYKIVVAVEQDRESHFTTEQLII